MDWTVVWLPDAEIELAELWLASIDREATTAAADQIDQLLRNSPETAGESRTADRRILIIPPLAVIYRAFPDDRFVRVSSVREIRRKNG
jgi:hypothetical protein